MTAQFPLVSSGGPVMDSSGAVIGISVATFQGGQNLNLAMPVKFLSKLLVSIVETGHDQPFRATSSRFLFWGIDSLWSWHSC